MKLLSECDHSGIFIRKYPTLIENISSQRELREVLRYAVVIMVDFTGFQRLVCRNICSAVGGAISVMFY